VAVTHPAADIYPLSDVFLDVSGDLDVIERLIDEFMAKYDPDLYVVTDATVMLERFSKLSRLWDSLKMRTARRLEKAHSYKQEGYRDAANWLSAITGDSVGQAADKLHTSKAAEAHQCVKEALDTGQISEAQAKEISSAADRCPQKADELVAEAQLLNHSQLKRRCSAIRQAASSAEDEVTRHERIRKDRYLRTWTDPDGAGRLDAKMTPDALAVILAGLGHFETGIFSEARKSGLRESHQAYMTDALVAMAVAASRTPATSGTLATSGVSADGSPDGSVDDAGGHRSKNPGSTKRPRRVTVLKPLLRIRVDGSALFRGHAEYGEVCEIPGVGKVPVALAREVLGDAILELVITRGTDVTTVVSDSRYIAKALRIALEERDPKCVVPGCNRSDPLEIDHWRVDFSKDGPTSLDNLARICHFDHDRKTHRGWKLEGGPGHWRFPKPDRTSVADPHSEVSGADPDSEVTDSAEARQARRRATPANDPPIQEGML
jgi:hypothetical protein